MKNPPKSITKRRQSFCFFETFVLNFMNAFKSTIYLLNMLHMTYDIQAFVRVIQKSQEHESFYLPAKQRMCLPKNVMYVLTIELTNLITTLKTWIWKWYVLLVACKVFFCISEMIAFFWNPIINVLTVLTNSVTVHYNVQKQHALTN